MSTTINTVATPASNTLTNTSTPAASVAKEQADFMTLLIAQMKNQDPTNPMDNNQMAAQIAQLNMVSGINKMNATLTGLSSNQQISNSMQATALIGHQVMVTSNKLQLTGGTSQMAMDLSQSADNVVVNISDSNGNLISTLNLGSKAAGIQNIRWNGQTNAGTPAADGAYTFDITATSQGAAVSTTALAAGTVQNVSISGNQVQVNVSTLGNVALADIHQVI
ncbi:MAG: flagellar hook capping FlgD N-terminal domain-containing protein [Methylococcaceae bacterium]